MNRTRRIGACLAGLTLTVFGLVGCQTQVPGTLQTLPSGRYLDHPPQYIPPSPEFPLSRELANMEAAAAGTGPTGFSPLPTPVPVAPGGPAPGDLGPPGM